MGVSVYGIGITGLQAAQAGLVTTGHNISNANTPGFSRQQIAQSTNSPVLTGAGFLGNGTRLDTIQRVYSQFVQSQVLSSETQSAYLSNYLSQMRELDNMLADSSAGVSPALHDFFNGVQDVASSPASVPSRQSMLSTAQAMVARFHSVDTRLREIRDGVDSEVRASISGINSYAAQIADLNERIRIAEGSSANGQSANDLLDQRDELLRKLSQEVRVTSVRQDDGSVNMFIGNGQALVVGAQAFKLDVVPSLEDPESFEIAYLSGANAVTISSTSLTGGRLGGLLAFRRDALDPIHNGLGRVAIGLAQQFNAQHQLGQDLTGALGGDFFVEGTARALAKTGTTAGLSAAVSIADAGALTTDDYRLQYNGGWQLTRFSTGQVVGMTGSGTVADPFLAEGMSIVVSGAVPANGDSFVVQPTRNGARELEVTLRDPRTIAAAAPIRTSAASSNSGDAAISPGSVDSAFLAAPLAAPVTLTYDRATNTFSGFPAASPVTVTSGGTVTNFAAGAPVTYTSGATISFDGISFTVSGSPGDGAQFTVEPNAGGVSDNRNALLLAALQTSEGLASGTTTYQGAYSQMVSSVGNRTRETEVAAEAQGALLQQTRDAQQSVSGVNLDEEAANLIRYQQAYQAAGRMVAIASGLFETILDIAR